MGLGVVCLRFLKFERFEGGKLGDTHTERKREREREKMSGAVFDICILLKAHLFIRSL